MEVKASVHETRNLGVRCAEVTLTRHDEEFELIAVKNDFDFITARLPIAHLAASKSLYEQGFHRYETQYSLRCSLTPLDNDIDEDSSVAELNYPDALRALRQHGFSIKSDRLALLGTFRPEVLLRRFCFWLGDEVRKGAIFREVQRRGVPVGFFLGREVSGAPHVAFSGVYDDCFNPTAGRSIETHMLKWASSFSRAIDVTVSSNNLSALRLHLQFGFNIRDAKEIFLWTNLERNLAIDI